MRLKQIKLSGFKSFVDPTVLDVPGQLIGVVGPNGCGKSNIMDAVRWVLGESRANELRGVFAGVLATDLDLVAAVGLWLDTSFATEFAVHRKIVMMLPGPPSECPRAAVR